MVGIGYSVFGVLGFLGILFFSQKLPMGSSQKNLEPFFRFDNLFKKYASEYGVKNWLWLKAICMNESSLGSYPSVAHGLLYPWDIEKSKSQDGKSWGIMQVTVTTAQTMDPSADAVKLNNAEYSVKLGAWYISKLQKMFAQSDPRYLEWVIKSYNQGPGNTKKEMQGSSSGFAHEYWDRFKRNLERAKNGSN